MNKSGQFFLIAALVIIVIIIGLSSLQISTKVSKENTRVYELKNEIELEGRSVVDHGVFVDKTFKQVQDHIVELMEYYAESNPGMNITVVLGNNDKYSIIEARERSLGGITEGGGIKLREVTKTEVTTTSGSCGGAETCIVEVEIDKEVEPVALTIEERQNFYVVIVDAPESTGERTVAVSG